MARKTVTSKRPDVPRTSPFRATPFLKAPPGGRKARLTDRQREELARISARLRLPARTAIYRQGSTAHSVYIVAEGVVTSYRDMPSGKRVVNGFLFARDLFGLAEEGRYVNSTRTITRVLLYRLPLDELTVLLKHDSALQLEFLVKVTHELRESQQRAILVNRRDAAGRLAMFVAMMRAQVDAAATDVPLPMTRSDIAGFLGLSLESVSRAAKELERRGIVAFVNRNLARILDPARLARLVASV